MRIVLPGLGLLALLAAGCAGVIVATDPHAPPVLAGDQAQEHGRPASLGIPPGHMPPPGQCRIWIPGRPPGHQPPPGRCASLERQLPAGAWLIYRPHRDREYVRVSVCHETRPAVIVAVRIFEYESGRFVREDRP